MPTIRFHFDLNLSIDAAYEAWRLQLTQETGELGETMTATDVELGPVIWEGGGDPYVTQSIPAEFLNFLTRHCPHTPIEILD